jgi:hypothetical protein
LILKKLKIRTIIFRYAISSKISIWIMNCYIKTKAKH